MTRLTPNVAKQSMNIPNKPDDRFFRALTGEDELGVVIRAQIYVEAGLTELIEACVPYAERLPRLAFEARLRLACALGLKEGTLKV